MRHDLLDAAIACIRLATGGDNDAIGSVALFVPGLEVAALDGDLIRASVIDPYGDHISQWVAQWDASVCGDERETALCILGRFGDAASPTYLRPDLG